MLYIAQTALQLGFIYGLVSLALFLSFRVLDIADLSTDGTFVLGMAVSVAVAAKGHPFLALLLAMISGMLSGTVTAVLQTRLGIPSILAGIITNTGLYTINLAVMGFSSNIALLKQDTIFSLLQKAGIPSVTILLPLLLFAAAAFLLKNFLNTRLGLSIRATGDNRDMVSASSIDPRFTITVGLAYANTMTALAGALVGQLQRSADINSGTGVVVVGLACLIIGETIIGRKTIGRNILAVMVGSILYRFLYAIILKTRLFPIECLKLVTAVIIALAIAMPNIKASYDLRKERNHAGNA
ncbi:MAG: ABC transporter permease [Erysipelotrichaceae bacterium]|nr:ABC transporter permease [Erysipelotrichaceae bacterium]